MDPAPTTITARITALNIYPVKSCAGVSLERARLSATGFDHDRQWLIVDPSGRFITQRELPRLALIRPTFDEQSLTLNAPELEPLTLPANHEGAATEVVCWKDRCAAIDAGDQAAQWLARYLGKPHRLVRFDPAFRRRSESEWTHGIEALNQFSDGFPWLLISQASLDELNAKLVTPLPMDRFRPNIVVDGLTAFDEDRVHELRIGEVALQPVKPCTRCAITTTDQRTGERRGDEPLRTLKSFRLNRELRGVTFGQNVILREGVGTWLAVGDSLAVCWRSAGAAERPS